MIKHIKAILDQANGSMVRRLKAAFDYSYCEAIKPTYEAYIAADANLSAEEKSAALTESATLVAAIHAETKGPWGDDEKYAVAVLKAVTPVFTKYEAYLSADAALRDDSRRIQMRTPQCFREALASLKACSAKRSRALTSLREAFARSVQKLLKAAKDAGGNGEEKMPAKPIEELLKIEENQTFERKSSTFYDYKNKCCNNALKHVIVKSVAGFMNKDGGTLLIGVHDDGTELGLEKDYACLKGKKKDRDGYQQVINQLLLNELGRPSSAHFKVTIEEHEGKDFCVVTVYRANTGVWIKQGLVLPVRTGNTTQQLSGKEAKEYLDGRSRNG